MQRGWGWCKPYSIFSANGPAMPFNSRFATPVGDGDLYWLGSKLAKAIGWVERNDISHPKSSSWLQIALGRCADVAIEPFLGIKS